MNTLLLIIPIYFFIVCSNSIVDTNWHHVVITKTTSLDASGVNVYVDNVNTSLIIAGNDLGGSSLNTEPIRAGQTGVNTGQFNGALDDIAIYNRVLSLAEISQLYND